MHPKWTCPKCRAADPLRVPGAKGQHGGVPMTRFVRGNLQPGRCICSACGFVEEYFERPEHLEALRRKYGAPAAKKPGRK